MIFTKNMIGKRIFALPTGNNARGGNAGKVSEFEVIKLGRKYVELAKVYENSKLGRVDTYNSSTGATQKATRSGYGGNSGYKFFESLDAIADYTYSIELKDEVSKMFACYVNNLKVKLSVDQLERIKAIINEPKS